MTMKHTHLALCASLLATAATSAQTVFPAVTPWKLNTTGATGFQGILADVQSVRYGQNYVYIAATGIPSYTIGPWPNNPGSPTNQNWSFRIPRTPVLATTQTTVGMGHVGVLVNGVTIFNPGDARSYNNLNIWHQNAMHFEVNGFDTALGHPAMVEYHHHQRKHTVRYTQYSVINDSYISQYITHITIITTTVTTSTITTAHAG